MAQVECRSDSEYAQRPIAFYYRKRRFEVGSLLAEWHEPEGKAFRVMTEEMEIFDLFYDQDKDEWEVKQA